jgi:hypothetical protein
MNTGSDSGAIITESDTNYLGSQSTELNTGLYIGLSGYNTSIIPAVNSASDALSVHEAVSGEPRAASGQSTSIDSGSAQDSGIKRKQGRPSKAVDGNQFIKPNILRPAPVSRIITVTYVWVLTKPNYFRKILQIPHYLQPVILCQNGGCEAIMKMY